MISLSTLVRQCEKCAFHLTPWHARVRAAATACAKQHHCHQHVILSKGCTLAHNAHASDGHQKALLSMSAVQCEVTTNTGLEVLAAPPLPAGGASATSLTAYQAATCWMAQLLPTMAVAADPPPLGSSCSHSLVLGQPACCRLATLCWQHQQHIALQTTTRHARQAA